MGVCIGVVGYLLPPEMRPSLTLSQAKLPCENSAACVEKIKPSMLDEGLKSISVFLNGYEQSAKAKLSNGKYSQSTLNARDLEMPWVGPERAERKRRS